MTYGMQFMHMFFAHLILDYPLQGTFLATVKAKYNFVLVVHCAIWAIGHFFMLNYLGIYEMWMFWWLFLGHLAMDWLKCHKLQWWCLEVNYWWHDRHIPAACYGEIDEHREASRSVLVESTVRTNPNWVDPLCLPLWIDQLFHVFQIWLVLQ